MAFQRTRRPSLRSGRSLRSLGSPLNAYPFGGFRGKATMSGIGVLLLLPVLCWGAPLFRSGARQGLVVAVVDREGNALPGVTVVIDPDPSVGTTRPLFQVVTDVWGHAAIPHARPGVYNVTACLLGLYADYEAKARLVQDRPVYVLLSMGLGEIPDPACPSPSLAPAVTFVAPVPLPRLPAGRPFPVLR